MKLYDTAQNNWIQKFYFPIVKNPFQSPEDSISPISTSDGNYLGIIIGASCGVLLLILVIVAAVVVSAHFGLTKKSFRHRANL